jgi:hypothetical protein
VKKFSAQKENKRLSWGGTRTNNKTANLRDLERKTNDLRDRGAADAHISR